MQFPSPDNSNPKRREECVTNFLDGQKSLLPINFRPKSVYNLPEKFLNDLLDGICLIALLCFGVAGIYTHK